MKEPQTACQLTDLHQQRQEAVGGRCLPRGDRCVSGLVEGPKTVGLVEVLEEHRRRGAKLGKYGPRGGAGIEYPEYPEAPA